MPRPLRVLIAIVCPVVLIASCGEDLGECDQAAAEELVYGRNGLVATKGQALAHDSCGGGAFCHSSHAEGENRAGAPAGLDFDLIPEPTGWPLLVEYRQDVWSAVSDGEMPPSGSDKIGDGDWRFDPARSIGSTRLPTLKSAAGQAIFRNWLACGAPLVDEAVLPDWAQPLSAQDFVQAGSGGASEPESSGDDEEQSGSGNSGGSGDSGNSGESGDEAPDWETIYADILTPNCATASCHDSSSAGGLRLTDVCDAWEAMFERGDCGAVRVRSGDEGSLLVDKLTNDDPSCGDRMPVGVPLRASDIDAVAAWVSAGAEAEGCQ